MELPYSIPTIAGCLALTLAPTAAAQTPATASAAASIVLSPFEVIANTGGYAATTTQVATGFNRDIQRTPLAVNILTEEFIREAGFNSYQEMSDFIPSAYVEPSNLDGGSTAFARGHGTSFYSQDGRRFYTDPVVSSGGRLEVVKGPATLFFGRAQPGGIFNFSTPPPSPQRRNTLNVSYGSFNSQTASLASQGRILPGKDWLTYRLDAQWQDNQMWIADSRSDNRSLRATVGVRPLSNLNLRLSFERSHKENTGDMRTVYRNNPQYDSDYRNPRAEQITWAKAAGRAGATATTPAAITFLQTRWRESSANWANDTRSIYDLATTVPRIIGVNPDATRYGWDYNSSLVGSSGTIDVKEWGGTATFMPWKFLSFKASYYKYDLDRLRNRIDMNTVSGDGVIRANPASLRNLNDSKTITGDVIANYSFGPFRNTTHAGASQYSDDFFQFTQATTVALPLNSIPKDIRASAGAQITPGWNPLTEDYPDITRYFAVSGDSLPGPSLSQFNREQARYASHIMELFDGKLGLLAGVRRQVYNDTFRVANRRVSTVSTFGASWEAKPDLVFYASTSTSFEPNSGQAFVEGNGTTVDERAAEPAPPREGQGWDIGAKFAFANRTLTGTFTVFETNRLNDFRTTDQLKTDNDSRNLDAITTNNVTWYTYGGERLTRGLETELMYQPSRNYVVVASFSYLPVAKIVDNPGIAKIALLNGTLVPNPQSANQVGARSSGSARYKTSLWNRYRFSAGPFNKLGLGLGLAYVDKVRLSTDPTIAGDAPAYVVGRAAIDYSLKLANRNVDLSLIVTNLFDERYYRGIFRESPRTFTLRASTEF
ncbi:MAG: hypothetical protein NTX09_14340 [Verrucomicrobia bacterium]|nr:hypothetical protein [Verrucomicrobiota bacterium]